jgi:hypothetical protein
MTPTGSLLLLLAALLPSAPVEIRGRLAAVDLDKNEVQIELLRPGRGPAITVRLEPATEITWARQPAQREDLTAGRRVRVVYEERDALKVAKSIQIIGLRPLRPAPSARPDGSLVTGILRRVAQTEPEVVVVRPAETGPNREVRFVVGNAVRVTVNGKVIPYEELKEEQQATVKSEKRDGLLVAVSIDVGGRPAVQPEPADQQNPRMSRLRLALELADWILQRMAERQKKGGEPRP